MEDKDTINKGGAQASEQEINDETSLINKEEEYEWGKHPNSLKAIEKHQFPKGVSGNPLGRKPSFDGIKKALDRVGTMHTYGWGDEDKGSLKEQVLERIWKKASGGDIQFVRLLAWLGCLDDK